MYELKRFTDNFVTTGLVPCVGNRHVLYSNPLRPYVVGYGHSVYHDLSNNDRNLGILKQCLFKSQNTNTRKF